MITVFYDGWCPLCRAARSRIERLDWMGLVRFQSTREPGVPEELGVAPEALERRMHARVERTGVVIDGIDAVAAIMARIPLMWPLYPGAVLLRSLGLGQRLYDIIASRRTVVPVGGCIDGVCELHKE